jgi:Ca2+-binding RTX toxin-like protein
MNSIGITDFKLGTSVIPEDQPLHFDIAAVDGDGDISATSGLDVLLTGGAGPGFTLTGTAASEVLVGGGDNDCLTGHGGADTLSGKAGADIFKYDAFTEGMDHILDFNAAEGDTIDVLVSGFAGLNPADVGKTADQVTGLFDANTSGTEATTADARFHFDAATHTLYYDSDGNAPGGAASVALATFDNDATVQAQNVHLV